MLKRVVIIFISLLVVMVVGGLAGRLIRMIVIDECEESGGHWNYITSKCDCYEQPDSSDVTMFTWHSVYDFCAENEKLVKGPLMDENVFTSWELIRVLNQRKTKCQLQLDDKNADTLYVDIVNSDALCESMGTTGAHNYLGESVLTLTEYGEVIYVRFNFEQGTHASPGLYSRDDFKVLLFD